MLLKKQISDSLNRCKSYRKRILEISQQVFALHLGGSYSCLEILDYIYEFHIPLRKKIKMIIFL